MEKDTNDVIVRRRLGGEWAEIRTGSKGQLIVRTQSVWFLPLALVEALILAALMTLNYFFRFDSTFVANNDFVRFENVFLSCEDSKLQYDFGRPYFDYGANDTSYAEGLDLKYNLPEWVFFLCALLTPIAMIFLVESTNLAFPHRRVKEIKSCGVVIPEFVRRLFRIIGGYLLGGSATGLFVSIFKLNLVSPRPHFMTVCFDNPPSYVFPNSCLSENLWSPFDDCSNGDTEAVVEALKSFPSYHAALAVYCGAFTFAYIILEGRIRGLYLTPATLLLGVSVMTMIGATHRLSSGYSFPRDIIGGALIGLLVAYYMTTQSQLRNFRERKMWIRKGKKTFASGKDDRRPQEGKYEERMQEEGEAEVESQENQEQHSKKESFVDENDSDSDFDSDVSISSDEYEKTLAKIDNSGFLIPRVTATETPTQAVNPTMNEGHPTPFPSQSTSKPVRSSSSVGQKESYAAPEYNVPKQRNSAPQSRFGGANDGHTNHGYQADKNEPKGILSAYEPPPGAQNSSRF